MKSSSFRWLVIVAVVATFVLVVMGGIVRVSGAGLGCPDWPLCHGQLIPPLDGPTLIEYSHRLAASLTTIFILATAAVAWRKFRNQKWIFRSAMIAVILLAVQIVVGGITVILELPPTIVAVHLGNALTILALLLIIAVFAFHPEAESKLGSADEGTRKYQRLVFGSTLATFVLILSGAVVTGTAAHYTCPTWPLCNDQIYPGTFMQQIAMWHRYIAVAIGLYIFYVIILTVRTRQGDPALVRAAWIATLFFIVQLVISALNVILDFPLWTTLSHLAGAAAFWGSMVVFTLLAYLTPETKSETGARGKPSPENSVGATLRDYFMLTKPLIVALLLTTTLGAMFVAQRGMPSLSIFLLTLLGGACSAGGANALNSYFDRDMDKVMARTSRRPLPTGKVEPRNALFFGIALCFLSMIIFGVFINGLSALLALVGIVYYAGIYTLWLKRRTPQSVVIGGAAGALPPLVGWAAVTNDISLMAIYLFLIIFYWTPPHTWALMLMVTKDYERVGVPMMPVARGETETRRQIFLYSMLLVAITLLPFTFGAFGWLYLFSAAVLGGLFVYLAVRVFRSGEKSTARQLYRYSNAYLALLFLIMVIDRGAIRA